MSFYGEHVVKVVSKLKICHNHINKKGEEVDDGSAPQPPNHWSMQCRRRRFRDSFRTSGKW
jgi:hypothetical protein